MLLLCPKYWYYRHVLLYAAAMNIYKLFWFREIREFGDLYYMHYI